MIKQEIFAVGKWNGFPFTLKDLQLMAHSFNALKDNLQVPLKLGHNDEQNMTDGQPALGWVTEVGVDTNSKPEKLVAVFDDMPDIVEGAMAKKLYRNVSIELDFDVSHKGTHYPYVITAVALLGADLPAVNVLNDLGAYLASRQNSNTPVSGYTANKHVSFSVINGSISEDNPMPKTLEEQLAEANAKAATAAAELAMEKANFSTYKTEQSAKTDQLQATVDSMLEKDKADKVTAARAKFTKILEDAVVAKDITPAQREAFSKVLKLDDDDAVLAINEEQVKGLFSSKKVDTKAQGQHTEDDADDASADQLITNKAYEYMAKTGEKDFTQATFAVMRADPKLSHEYVMLNGEA